MQLDTRSRFSKAFSFFNHFLIKREINSFFMSFSTFPQNSLACFKSCYRLGPSPGEPAKKVRSSTQCSSIGTLSNLNHEVPHMSFLLHNGPSKIPLLTTLITLRVVHRSWFLWYRQQKNQLVRRDPKTNLIISIGYHSLFF